MKTLSQEREDHLKERVQNVQYQLNMDRARDKVATERQRLIAKTQTVVGRLDFWCRGCRLDFVAGRAPLRTSDYHGEPIAFYVARCPRCRRKAVRRVTDKSEDPYYSRSKKLRRQRISAAADVLQPHEWGFETHYPEALREHARKLQKGQESVERMHFDISTRFSRSRALKRDLRLADYRTGERS